jgi:hypothetical protein
LIKEDFSKHVKDVVGIAHLTELHNWQRQALCQII